ncbi:hypothetical protein PAMP_004212 [Pampus punctatissimus]
MFLLDQNQTRTRPEPNQNQNQTRTQPEPDQNPTRTRPEPDQNQTRTRPEPDQNPTRRYQDVLRVPAGVVILLYCVNLISTLSVCVRRCDV